MKQIIALTIITLLSIGSANSQQITSAFFDQVDQFMKSEVENGLLDYGSLTSNNQLTQLIETVKAADISSLDAQSTKAFYINAYNLHVINSVTSAYPINSPLSVSGFFDRKKVVVANEKMTLNNLEKKKLLNVYNDGRLHFVLVCGAHGCPPITNFAYTPELLDEQLESQTRLALNDANFLKVEGDKAQLSEIFDWYPADFGGSKSGIIDFINTYRETPLASSTKISHYDYDWTLNDASNASAGAGGVIKKGNNDSRYIVSSTIAKGSSESKVFNNLYTQRTGNGNGTELTNRSTFFTTTYNYLYGVSNRFNLGVSARYRRVRNDTADSSPLSVLGGSEAESQRTGLTAIGPQIRFAPVKEWSNFSIQSQFLFAIGDDLTGNAEQPFIDWDGATFWTQIFNDFPIGNNFSLFTELDFLIEDIGRSSTGHINRFSTPVTAIFSYNPTPKATIYTLGSYSPFWQSDFDYFYQYGVGFKYQFTPSVELELLVTDFTNEFLSNSGGQASTWNVGYRFNF